MLLVTLLSWSHHFLRAVLLNGAQKKLFYLLSRGYKGRSTLAHPHGLWFTFIFTKRNFLIENYFLWAIFTVRYICQMYDLFYCFAYFWHENLAVKRKHFSNVLECSKSVRLFPNMAQINKFYAGVFAFGSLILMPKWCEYIKSGHTFGRQAINIVICWEAEVTYTCIYPTEMLHERRLTV
jgi:hypothetical protein